MLSRLMVGGVCAAVAVCTGCGSGVGDAAQDGATSSRSQDRFAKCSSENSVDRSDAGEATQESNAKSNDWLLSSASASYIQDIDQFLNTCPQNDPAFATIISDFQIRKNGGVVTSFPCSEPISAMPVSQYTDELIVLQGLRVLYYMDLGRSGHIPWTSGTLYEWIRSKIAGINLSSAGPSCCLSIDGGRFINIPLSNDANRDFDRRWEGVSGNLSLYAHEARHVDGFGHTSCCSVSSGCDPAYDEANQSAYGIQWWLNWAWLTGHIDVGYACLGSRRVRDISNWHLGSCNNTYAPRFCDVLPPVLDMPLYPGTTSTDGPACGTGCVTTAECDDGLACNGPETCVDGACRPGLPVNCDDGVSCTVDACTEPSGACMNVASDGLCDDSDACTVDFCDSSLGCVSTTSQPCCGNQVCETGEDCDLCPTDCLRGASSFCGNGVCDPGEDCTAGSCPEDCRGKQSGKRGSRFCCSGTTGGAGGENPVDCSDAVCSSNGWSCNSAGSSSSCCGDGWCEAGEDGSNCPIDCACASAAACDDGNACTMDDCVGGFCFSAPLDCDDGDPCTVDSCDAAGACAHEFDAHCGACGGSGTACATNADCCSNKCKGGLCRGN